VSSTGVVCAAERAELYEPVVRDGVITNDAPLSSSDTAIGGGARSGSGSGSGSGSSLTMVESSGARSPATAAALGRATQAERALGFDLAPQCLFGIFEARRQRQRIFGASMDGTAS